MLSKKDCFVRWVTKNLPHDTKYRAEGFLIIICYYRLLSDL